MCPSVVAYDALELIQEWSVSETEYREFGRTKVKVSAIGMGTYYDVSWIMESRLLSHREGQRREDCCLEAWHRAGHQPNRHS